jgi:Ras family protein A
MAVAQRMGARYMECSSKEMTGVDEIFLEAINIDPSTKKRRQEATPSGQSGSMRKKKKRTCKIL